MADPSSLSFQNEIIGRLLTELASHGVRRVALSLPSIFDVENLHQMGEDENGLDQVWHDVLEWLRDEGVIRFHAYEFGGDEGSIAVQVQLTATGLQLVQAPLDILEKRAITAIPPKPDVSSGTYTKIGNVIGGMLGSFTKSIS